MFTAKQFGEAYVKAIKNNWHTQQMARELRCEEQTLKYYLKQAAAEAANLGQSFKQIPSKVRDKVDAPDWAIDTFKRLAPPKWKLNFYVTRGYRRGVCSIRRSVTGELIHTVSVTCPDDKCTVANLWVLLHEIAHARAGLHNKHNRHFWSVAINLYEMYGRNVLEYAGANDYATGRQYIANYLRYGKMSVSLVDLVNSEMERN